MGRLNWDTFPKSGTMWLKNCLDSSFLNYENVFGGHRINTLRKKENVITIIRNPKDTVSSYIYFFGNLQLCMGCGTHHTFNKVENIFNWYCRFLQGMIDNRNRIYIATFEKITENPYETMVEYSKYFSLHKPNLITKEEIKEKTIKTYPQNMPKPLTQERLNINNTVATNSSLDDAIKMYRKVKAIIGE